MSLNCLVITLTAGVILKEEEMPSRVGERQFGRHFRRQYGRGQLRVKNCLETVGRQILPRGIKMSRRALWAEIILSFCEFACEPAMLHIGVVGQDISKWRFQKGGLKQNFWSLSCFLSGWSVYLRWLDLRESIRRLFARITRAFPN